MSDQEPDKQEALNQGMAVLRQRYTAQLPSSIADIQRFVNHCRRQTASQYHYEKMRQLAHKMAGSGKTYGFSRISQLARVLELSLDDVSSVTLSGLADMGEELMVACSQAMAEEAPGDTAGQMPETEPMRVVVASQDEAFLTIIQELLKEAAVCDILSQPREIMPHIEKHPPTILLLDDNLPHTPWQEIATLTANNPLFASMQLMVLSADRSPEAESAATRLGVAEMIHKPLHPMQVADSIRSRLSGDKKTILVIDDDRMVCEHLEYRLKVEGFNVEVAENGQQGLECAAKKTPDLIILDRTMPKMGGMETLAKLKENPSLADIPVIMLTANRNESEIEKAYQAGADSYVVKPYEMEEVLSKCHKLLNRQAIR